MTLNDIVKNVQKRLSERKTRVSLDDLKIRIKEAGPTYDFIESIHRREGSRIRMIAEVKKASPSKGVIRKDFDPVKIAEAYESSGASAISVLTEEDSFLGHPEYLKKIRERVKVPLLRKDFILEPYQVMEARVWGADAYLLIVSLLNDHELEELINMGQDLNMTALVETHSQSELDRALNSSAKVIGINNRNLKTFVTDLETTFKLMKGIPKGRVVVSESGIQSPEDLKRLESVGVDAVLVGEAFMRSPRPGEKLRELLHY